MSKDLAVQDKEALAKWAELNNATTFTRPNTIRLDNSPFKDEEKNPNYGKLFAFYTENGVEVEEEIPLDKAEFKFIAAKVYVKCTEYGDDGPLFRTNEIDNTQRDYIVLTNPDGSELAKGLYAEVKDEYPVKYSENVYVEYDGRVYRWNLTGAHFDSWFRVKNILARKPMTFKVTGTKDEKKGTNNYKSLIFELGDEYPVTEALKLREALDTFLTAQPSQSVTEEKVVEDLPWEDEKEEEKK